LFDAIGRANKANILFVAAAGNSSANNDVSAFYPANYNQPNIISVAAIDSYGNLASFSNYGATKVHLGAPGQNILSTYPDSTGASYQYLSGTSMATPHVTGACALYAAAYLAKTGAVPSAAQIKSAILGTVAPLPALSGKTVTGGRLDASRLYVGSGAAGL
jgi:subtilisin family serine protease